MKSKSQNKNIFSTASELALLIAIIAVGGFLLPIFLAPYVADILSITTPYEEARQAMSIQVNNRNAAHGETFSVGVSNPDSSVRMTAFSYSCDYPQITLAYLDGQHSKEIPCDKNLILPAGTQHEFLVMTAKREITYMPINLVLENRGEQGDLSVVIAVAARNVDALSRLSDSSTAQLQTFPTR